MTKSKVTGKQAKHIALENFKIGFGVAVDWIIEHLSDEEKNAIWEKTRAILESKPKKEVSTMTDKQAKSIALENFEIGFGVAVDRIIEHMSDEEKKAFWVKMRPILEEELKKEDASWDE